MQYLLVLGDNTKKTPNGDRVKYRGDAAVVLHHPYPWGPDNLLAQAWSASECHRCLKEIPNGKHRQLVVQAKA